jgi:hypothetical protein
MCVVFLALWPVILDTVLRRLDPRGALAPARRDPSAAASGPSMLFRRLAVVRPMIAGTASGAKVTHRRRHPAWWVGSPEAGGRIAEPPDRRAR